jgi:hypothetical protein
MIKIIAEYPFVRNLNVPNSTVEKKSILVTFLISMTKHPREQLKGLKINFGSTCQRIQSMVLPMHLGNRSFWWKKPVMFYSRPFITSGRQKTECRQEEAMHSIHPRTCPQ